MLLLQFASLLLPGLLSVMQLFGSIVAELLTPQASSQLTSGVQAGVALQGCCF